MASAYQPELHSQAQKIERKLKTLINETLKQICRVEGLQVSGLKNHLQTRIINKIDQYVALGNVDGLNRLEHAVNNGGHAPPSSSTPRSAYNNSSSPPTPAGSSRMPNGWAAAAHGAPYRGPNTPDSKVRWKNTPFFEIIRPLTPTLEFPKVEIEGHRQQMQMKLTLPDDLAERMRMDSKLRVMLYSAGEPIMGGSYGMLHDVDFPQNMEVKVNHTEDVKWNHKGLKNKPGSAQPGDLTAFIRKQPSYSNHVGIMYALTTKRFYMNIMLVQKSTPEDLTRRLANKATITKSRVVREMLAKAADPDIEATSTNMSLKDPISMLRMTVPIRSDVCTHNQCFDAFMFLDMQQQGPTWTCPICSKPVTYDSLHIDEYVQDILKGAPNLDQVTLDPDGTWRPVVEKADTGPRGMKREYDDDDSDDLVEIADYRPNGLKAETPATPFSFGQTPPLYSPVPGSATRTNGNGGTGSKRKSEVIDLTLSDDDDNDAGPPPAKRQQTARSESSSDLVRRLGQPNGNLNGSYRATSSITPNGVQPFALPSNTASSTSYNPPPVPRQASNVYREPWYGGGGQPANFNPR